MKFRVLSMLMWKHLLVKKRRFILTAVEIVSPIVLIVILYIVKDQLNPVPKHGGDTVNLILHDPKPLERVSKPTMVHFLPDTTLVRQLMEKVNNRFKNSSPVTTLFIPFNNESEVYNQTKNMNHNQAIVIFQNMADVELPETLNYTIRMRSAFMTNVYHSFDGMKVPHTGFGSIYEPFMSLQWAIDMSYLELRTGKEMNQRVTLQEFPYYRRSGNAGAELIGDLMPFICDASVLITFVIVMSRLLRERASGIQELMKMMGVSKGSLALSHLLSMLVPGLVFTLVSGTLLVVSSNPILRETNVLLLYITFFLYYYTLVTFAMPCSYITSNTQYAVSLAVIIHAMSSIPYLALSSRELPYGAVVACGFMLHQPVAWVFTEVASLEKYGSGLTFSTMATAHSPRSGCALAAIAIMLLQIAVCLALTWYLDQVRPGKYGQGVPWNFMFKKSYWSKNNIGPNSELEDLEVPERNEKYFEPLPASQEVGIKVVDVTKIYGKFRALNDVSLEVLRGEITVLLGHNGAGKTTLMNIITGMLGATKGKVYVNGLDTTSTAHRRARRVGLCPQHNIFFEDLTVMEHVMFFTLLRGGTFQEAKQSSADLLNKLGIISKQNNKSAELSGGMKRRLQLACALAGDSDVLILDEPTSGLDVETRRELWDLLLSLRGSRCVVLSTHFMEEADALGDRVAALHAGQLKCHATPLYLKRAIGTGYRLTFTTIGEPKEAEITAAVRAHVPGATLKEATINSLNYSLPATSSDKFPQLFSKLEYDRSQLGIDSIGVGVSTLEEVFLRLCSDVDTTVLPHDEVDTITPDDNPLPRSTGRVLLWRQFVALLKRQYRYAKSKKIFILVELILPIVMIFLIFFACRGTLEEESSANLNLPLDLDVYRAMPERRVLYHGNTDHGLKEVRKRYPDVEFEESYDIQDAVLRTSKENNYEYNKYLAGVEYNDTDIKVLYTTTVRHAAPVALALASELAAASVLPGVQRPTTAHNHPLLGPGDGLPQPKQPKSMAVSVICLFGVFFVMQATCIQAVTLAARSRVQGARRQQLLAGAGFVPAWGAAFTARMILVVMALLIPAAIAAAALDETDTFNNAQFIWAMSVCILVGCAALVSLSFLVSCWCGEHAAGFVLLVLMMVFGLIMPLVKSAKDLFNQDKATSITDMLLRASSYCLPPHTFTMAGAQCALTARLNAFCSLNRDKCPNLFIAEPAFDADKCCQSSGSPYGYFSSESHAPGPLILCFFLQCVVLMTLVMLSERGVLKRLFERCVNAKYVPPPQRYSDEMARAERAYVQKAITLPTKQISDAMLVSDLHKKYYGLVGKPCNAVRGISFSVKKGECFGLLGVNGAGKSTAFKILTGEEPPTRGAVSAAQHRLNGHSPKYLESIGYCPQFHGLDPFLTGFQNIELLLTLYGCGPGDVGAEANLWINIVGLERYAHRPVSGYSGGMARRLAAAMSLCRGAPLALLDEPTAGVDVAARRRVWAALRHGLARHRAVIITSHSMDEMEALCDRIAIMSLGEVCALGSPAALRAAHAAGHAVIIKVRGSRPGADEVDSGVSIDSLKGTFSRKFNCTLKDEHKTMLHYHINETMQYSSLFHELESLKASFPHLIEDYSVTETTLEEVFLSFAKNAAEPDKDAPV